MSKAKPMAAMTQMSHWVDVSRGPGTVESMAECFAGRGKGAQADNTCSYYCGALGQRALPYEFQAHGGESDHPQQEPPVAPAGDVRFSVGAGSVTDWQVQHPQIQLGRAKKQIEIAEWIEVAKVGAITRDLFILESEQHLGATKSVFDRLSEQP